MILDGSLRLICILEFLNRIISILIVVEYLILTVIDFEITNNILIIYATDDFSSVIQETEIKKLFVVSAGVIPPNPSELLGSERMRELVSQME